MIIFTYEIDSEGAAWINPSNMNKWDGVQYDIVKMEPFGTDIICFEISVFGPASSNFNTVIYSRVYPNNKGAITLDSRVNTRANRVNIK